MFPFVYIMLRVNINISFETIFRRLAATLAAFVLANAAVCTFASAEDDPSEALSGHFDAISEQDFSEAERFFSESFRAAIMPKVKFVNSYLLEIKASLFGGYELSAPAVLEDERFVRVKADFAETSVYYYLIRQAGGWRIEAFSENEYSTMADGRRELYLFTNRDWNDDVSKDLKCRAALYQIQRELEAFRDEKGEGFYPPYLRGGKARDALTSWGYFDPEKGYPANYHTGRPMEAAEFGISIRKPSPGDFTYLPVDADGDGKIEAYFLAGWGKPDSPAALFLGGSIVGLVASADERREAMVVMDFIDFALSEFGITLVWTGGD